jgi:ABC-type Fe3+/spermidine/putrescine transport system ATPase subunit
VFCPAYLGHSTDLKIIAIPKSHSQAGPYRRSIIPIKFLTLLQDLLRQAGCTTIFVTHDREEALRLGDRIAVIIDGGVRQVGRPAEVFGRPVTEEVARFVGVETILDGRVVDDRDGLLSVGINGAKIEALGRVSTGEHVLVCLRPEDVVIRLPGDHGAKESARNRLEGVVRKPCLEPSIVFRYLAAPGGGLVTKQSFEDMQPPASPWCHVQGFRGAPHPTVTSPFAPIR